MDVAVAVDECAFTISKIAVPADQEAVFLFRTTWEHLQQPAWTA